jgi:hypothetical protein
MHFNWESFDLGVMAGIFFMVMVGTILICLEDSWKRQHNTDRRNER